MLQCQSSRPRCKATCETAVHSHWESQLNQQILLYPSLKRIYRDTYRIGKLHTTISTVCPRSWMADAHQLSFGCLPAHMVFKPTGPHLISITRLLVYYVNQYLKQENTLSVNVLPFRTSVAWHGRIFIVF